MAKLEVNVQKNSQNINMVVSINAPLEKVYQAYTDSQLITQWWNQGQPFTVDYYVPGVGGKWRYVMAGPQGEIGFHGTFHAWEENKMLIQTFEYEGLPETGHVALERADFIRISEYETEIRIISTFQNVEDRDGMVASGMEKGFRESINALGRLLEK